MPNAESSRVCWGVAAVMVVLFAVFSPRAGAQRLAAVSVDPYAGAIVVESATGGVLFEDRADRSGYPASMIKLMNLLIVVEGVEKGTLRLDEKVPITAEAARIGGSQVYLKEGETFTIDDLLYALIIQSANDAATALAIHVAGSKEAFVAQMSRRATELGMRSTRFASVHGLPPGKGQQADISTPRDFALLCRELVRHPTVLRYTSATQRPFRGGTFILRTHNHLLGNVDGCDGLKTGYFTAAGFSIAVSAIRNDRRIIAVVFGSKSRQTRDAKARELLTRGFQTLPPPPMPAPVVQATPTNPPPSATAPAESPHRHRVRTVLLMALAVIVAGGVVWRLAAISHLKSKFDFH